MDSQDARISVSGLFFRLVSIALLVFLLMKSQAALSKAKEGLAVVEPVWKTGEATTGKATAEGPVTKTRIFFKAQGVLLEYSVNGTPYSCHTRMLKKDFDKLDGEKGDRDGVADVLLRYDPQNPSNAATEQSFNVLKKEKDSYTAVKWISIIYLVMDVFTLLIAIISAIGQSMERRKTEALLRKRMEEAQRAREAREAAERARRAQEAAEQARRAERARQEAAERARREAAERERREAEERAQKEAAEKARQQAEWDKVLDDALREAQDQNKADAGKQAEETELSPAEVEEAARLKAINRFLVDSIGKKIKVCQEVANALNLQNVTTQWCRAEEIKEKYHFVVSRAVMPLADLVKIIRKNISPEQINGMPNGIICLKGGELANETLPLKNQTQIYPLSDYFEEPFFETKKVVYTQLC